MSFDSLSFSIHLSPYQSLEESLGLWPELFIKYKLLIDMGFLVLSIHLLPLVHKEHILNFLSTEVDLSTQSVTVSSITLEKHRWWPVHFIWDLIRSSFSKSPVNFLAINFKLIFIDTTRWCFSIIPYPQSTQSHRLLKQEHYVIGLSFLGLIFFRRRGIRVAFGVLVRGQPNMVVRPSLILAVN